MSSVLESRAFGASRVGAAVLCLMTAAFFLVVPWLVSPTQNALMLIPIGVGLMAAAALNARPWLAIAVRCSRAEEKADAHGGFIFSHGTTKTTGGHAKRMGAGWAVATDDGVTFRFAHGRSSFAKQTETLSLDQDDLISVRQIARSGFKYPAVEIKTRTGDCLSVQVVAKNGSGLRGPSQAEIDAAIRVLTRAA